VFVRYGNFDAGFTLKSGGLVYESPKPGSSWSVHVTSLDQDSRPGGWQRLELHGDNTNNLNPWTQWSHDAKQVVYETGDGQGQGVVRVRNLSTGEDREVYHSAGKIECVWAAREAKLFCIETQEKAEILSIATDSRVIERLGSVDARWIWLASRDGRALYTMRSANDSTATVRWDIAARTETILQEDPLAALLGPPLVSRDERWLIRHTNQHIDVRPISGGDWKRLVSVNSPTIYGCGCFGCFAHYAVTPDGNWLLFHDTDSAGKQILFRVPISGGLPERLGDFPTSSTCCGMEISPDGRKLVVNSYDYSGSELWELENFVPTRQ
jgi:hypothetical protein